MTSIDRDKDFIILFVRGDLVVLPTRNLDALLEDMINDQVEHKDFIQSRTFFIDNNIMASLPPMKLVSDAPASPRPPAV
ncbi:MAG: hypothetical protein M1457_06410 [bacterium]|nr:hypothetical protein [bacterium]